MSRIFRRQALQRVPSISDSPDPSKLSFHGDSLDRLLNGCMTRELLIEAEKASKKSEPIKECPIYKWDEKAPLIAVMYDNHCACGASHPSFGFLARITANRTLARDIPDVGEKPASVTILPNEVPYCFICLNRSVQ